MKLNEQESHVLNLPALFFTESNIQHIRQIGESAAADSIDSPAAFIYNKNRTNERNGAKK